MATIKFNSSSKDFLLNWSYVDGSSSGHKDPVISVLSQRANKFLEKPSAKISTKIGSPEVTVKTPVLSPRANRNQKQRSTFYIGQNAPRSVSTICPPSRTTEQWMKLDKKHEEAKLDKIRKKKEETSKLENDKWNKLKKKLLQRQPFRF